MNNIFYFSGKKITFLAYFPGYFLNICKFVMPLDNLVDAELHNIAHA